LGLKVAEFAGLKLSEQLPQKVVAIAKYGEEARLIAIPVNG
jgi:hypothetical protein